MSFADDNSETPSLQLLDWEGEFFRREAALAIAYRETSSALAAFDASARMKAPSLRRELERVMSAAASLEHHLSLL